MKKKLAILISACLLFNNTLRAQNLIYNGNFEIYSGTCPTSSPNGAFTQVTGWSPPNAMPGYGIPHAELYCNSTPNYGNCLPGPVPNTGSNGPSYVGFHTRSITPPYNEAIYQQLLQPLTTGNLYTVSFDLMTCQSGLFINGKSNFCMYVNVDTVIPGCPTTNPNVVKVGCVPFDSISNTSWKHHIFSFTAPVSSNVIAFSGDSCFTTDIYYYLDNVVLMVDSTSSINNFSNTTYEGFLLNPISEQADFVFDYNPNETYSFEIIDCMGKTVRRYPSINTGKINISRHGIQNGVYFYRLLKSGVPLISGKVVMQ